MVAGEQLADGEAVGKTSASSASLPVLLLASLRPLCL